MDRERIWKRQDMLVEETKMTDKREEINLRNKKRRLRLAIIMAAIVLVVSVALLVMHLQTRQFADYKVVSQTELNQNIISYKEGNGLLFLCSNDGAKALSAEGNVKWEMSYHLDNPAIEYCGEVAAVADIGGNTVYIVAENGIPYNYRVVHPIVKHAVAKQGLTAVLLDNGTEDFIQLYDINGKLRVDIKTKTKTDGIPADIALSADGKKLVTLYQTFSGSEIIGKVTFYNAGEVGKNYIGNVVGQKTFDNNVLVYDVGFLSEDCVYILFENGFCVYRMTEVPELLLEQTTENEILDVEVTENGIYLVEKQSSGQILMYYYKVETGLFSEIFGERVWTDIPEYEAIAASKDEIVFFSPQSMVIYRGNQSLKYEGNFKSGLETVFPIGGNQYFLVDTGKVQTIKLVNKKQGVEK